jgi:predicted acyl esterase
LEYRQKSTEQEEKTMMIRRKLIKIWITASLFLILPVLLVYPQQRYPIPEPKYKVRVERSVMIPMRDGVRLSTDLYFPVGAGEKLPVIVIRTPYNKERFYKTEWFGSYFFAEQGFVVAVQDCRGKFESEGDYLYIVADTDDGYDMVTWAATQPWSNGNVGRYGCSYLGENQMVQVRVKNSHLKCIVPQAGAALGSAGGRYRYIALLNGGTIELASAVAWCHLYGSKYFFRPPPGMSRELFLRVDPFFDPAPRVPDVDFPALMKTLPIVDILKKAGSPPTDYEDFVSHEPGDPWWEQFGHITDSDRFDVPALHINSWYDMGVADTLYNFNLMKRNAESDLCRDNQFVIISPTTHCRSEGVSESTVIGERNLGDAQFDYWGTYIRWFDYWLRGADNEITEMPKVQIFVMGKNEWRDENDWPLARTRYMKYYFHSDGYANSRFGTGTLSTDMPSQEPPDRYVYDPKTPVPTLGGAICMACTGNTVPDGAFDQAEIETRHDVLVYSTPPLKQGVEVTGLLKMVLYVASSAKDTDFTGKLVDVYPDGRAFIIQEGILRARYREGFTKKVWMKPGGIYKLDVDLHATSNYFKPGHRIRVEVSSSNFPRFDRNLNTGGNNFDETEWVIAENTIHHSKKYPSHIILPVIEE